MVVRFRFRLRCGRWLSSRKLMFICEHCGERNFWTFGPGESVWVHCSHECESFMASVAQVELFPEFGVDKSVKGDGPQDAGRANPQYNGPPLQGALLNKEVKHGGPEER